MEFRNLQEKLEKESGYVKHFRALTTVKLCIMSCLHIVFNQRMAYTEVLMIKLTTLLKIIWVMEFDKANFSI